MLRRFEGAKVWGAVLGLVLLVVFFELVFYDSFIGSDDAYIHLRYIENVQTGHGFGFNPDHPSNGSTSPLWVMVAASIARGANLLLSVKYLSILLFAISILIFYAIVQSLLSSPLLALGTVAIYASDAWLLKWAGSAMESSLVAVLMLSIVWLLLRSNKWRYLLLSSFLMGAATLARPETFLMFVLLSAFLLIQPGAWRMKIKRGVMASIAYVSVQVPWFIFTVITFGLCLPNTFLAKAVASDATIWQVGWYFLRIIGVSYGWVWAMGFLSIIAILVRWVKQRALPALDFSSQVMVLLWIWCAVIPLFYTVSKLQTPSTRYLQLTTPILLALGAILLVRWVRTLSLNWRAMRFQGLWATVAIVGILVYNLVLNVAVVLPSSHDFSEGILQTYQDTGKWLRSNTPENSRIAVAIDVGAIGYFSHRDIIDLGGLNTPEVIPYLRDNLQYVWLAKPAYLVVTGEGCQYALLDRTEFKPVAVPISSMPMQLGMRAALEQTTAGGASVDKCISIYRMHWQ